MPASFAVLSASVIGPVDLCRLLGSRALRYRIGKPGSE
jgi:hypothetical protein